jgi:hypothetical protein
MSTLLVGALLALIISLTSSAGAQDVDVPADTF